MLVLKLTDDDVDYDDDGAGDDDFGIVSASFTRCVKVLSALLARMQIGVSSSNPGCV